MPRKNRSKSAGSEIPRNLEKMLEKERQMKMQRLMATNPPSSTAPELSPTSPVNQVAISSAKRRRTSEVPQTHARTELQKPAATRRETEPANLSLSAQAETMNSEGKPFVKTSRNSRPRPESRERSKTVTFQEESATEVSDEESICYSPSWEGYRENIRKTRERDASKRKRERSERNRLVKPLPPDSLVVLPLRLPNRNSSAPMLANFDTKETRHSFETPRSSETSLRPPPQKSRSQNLVSRDPTTLVSALRQPHRNANIALDSPVQPRTRRSQSVGSTASLDTRCPPPVIPVRNASRPAPTDPTAMPSNRPLDPNPNGTSQGGRRRSFLARLSQGPAFFQKLGADSSTQDKGADEARGRSGHTSAKEDIAPQKHSPVKFYNSMPKSIPYDANSSGPAPQSSSMEANIRMKPEPRALASNVQIGSLTTVTANDGKQRATVASAGSNVSRPRPHQIDKQRIQDMVKNASNEPPITAHPALRDDLRPSLVSKEDSSDYFNFVNEKYDPPSLTLHSPLEPKLHPRKPRSDDKVNASDAALKITAHETPKHGSSTPAIIERRQQPDSSQKPASNLRRASAVSGRQHMPQRGQVVPELKIAPETHGSHPSPDPSSSASSSAEDTDATHWSSAATTPDCSRPQSKRDNSIDSLQLGEPRRDHRHATDSMGWAGGRSASRDRQSRAGQRVAEASPLAMLVSDPLSIAAFARGFSGSGPKKQSAPVAAPLADRERSLYVDARAQSAIELVATVKTRQPPKHQLPGFQRPMPSSPSVPYSDSELEVTSRQTLAPAKPDEKTRPTSSQEMSSTTGLLSSSAAFLKGARKSAAQATSRMILSPQNSVAGPRPSVEKKPESIAKMLVQCCKCKYFHDMPSKVYACMAYPNSVVEDKELGVSGSITTTVRCPWCAHGMSTECCSGYSAIVYLTEKLHGAGVV